MIADWIKSARAAAAAGIQLKHWAGKHKRSLAVVRLDSSCGGGKIPSHKKSLNKIKRTIRGSGGAVNLNNTPPPQTI